MSLSKQEISELIRRRRYTSLIMNIERLQGVASMFDYFYEQYYYVPPEEVPPYVYRHWYSTIINTPRNPKVVGPQQIVTIHAEPKDHEWMLSQLLE